MYSSNHNGYQKFNPSPPLAAPPNQIYSANAPSLGGKEIPWSSGLCDCCSDVPNCCVTSWCPCITFGLISETLDGGYTLCAGNGMIYGCLMCTTAIGGCLYSCIYRSKMRRQYMLKESPCGDCLVHCFCEGCALCQEYRELKSRGFNMSIGWEASVERQKQRAAMAPVVPGAMSR